MKRRLSALFLIVLCAVMCFCIALCGDENTPHSHSYDEWQETKTPTCTENGLKEQYCTCGNKNIEVIPANGHTEKTVSGKAATCTETGLTEGKKCTVCGETTLEQEIITANGHTEETIAGKDATCTETGLTDGKKCIVCEETTLEQEIIPANGHTEETIAGKDATCTETGLTDGKKCIVCEETTLKQEIIPANGHTEETVAGKDATCTETGLTDGKKCTVCGETTLEQEIIPANGHTEETVAGKDATCTETGLTDGKKCTVCGETTLEQEMISALGHYYGDDNKCVRCGKIKEPLYTRVDEDTILFGSYPQTEVTDSTLISTLNTLSGMLPTSSNAQSWTSYGYYVDGSISNFMWYIDIEEGGEKYRGVYFTSYRPYFCELSSSTDNAYQDDNGYTTSNIYWFKYEPISWTILNEETGLIICDMIIDSQNYHINNSSHTVDGTTIYANNYEYSTIRVWLNDNFYNTAFDELQKEIILTTKVDNSAASTGSSINQDACCEDTEDKVFLLSYMESITYLTTYTSRMRKTTDYAQSQGAFTSTSSSYLGNGHWWLRSPLVDYYRETAKYVDLDGSILYSFIYYNDYGVVPALQIQLSKKQEHIHTEETIAGKDATCTETGLTAGKKCTVCGETTLAQETIAALDHYYGDDNKCDRCGEIKPLYTRADEDTILFGTYPQTEVTDSTLKSILNSLAGTLPTSSNAQAWTSYGYYVNGSVSNYMWYIDVENGGEKYRGVYFTSYRPRYTKYGNSTSNTRQDDNGYTTSNIYWFKYEPISWTILNENNGTALILCDMIIDSQQFDYENGSYYNDYAESTVRKWLNETFYNTAFDELQKEIILTTTVDNSVASTGYSSNSYACEDTEDKVFLLSYKELTTYLTTNASRMKKTTDYAQSQGAFTSTSSSYLGNGYWWLRSPDSGHSTSARNVSTDGSISDSNSYYYTPVNDNSTGVVPALQIQL